MVRHILNAGLVAWLAARKEWVGTASTTPESNANGVVNNDNDDPNDISFPLRPRSLWDQWRFALIPSAQMCTLLKALNAKALRFMSLTAPHFQNFAFNLLFRSFLAASMLAARSEANIHSGFGECGIVSMHYSSSIHSAGVLCVTNSLVTKTEWTISCDTEREIPLFADHLKVKLQLFTNFKMAPFLKLACH
jgi:hypothetical protein